MLTNIIFVIFVILWSLATGFREGCMWNDNWEQRLPLDYHFWRTVEIGTIVGMLLTYQSLWLLVGAGMFGLSMVYERALQYIDYGDFFHKQKPWKILNWEIPFTNTFMILIGTVGLSIMIILLILTM